MGRRNRIGVADRSAQELLDSVRQLSHPLRGPQDLDPLLERIGDARFVLLGEASHGTHEYYTWRAELSQRLIVEKGFSFIAVEGDWPDCYRVNRFIKGYPDSGDNARGVLYSFQRWPTWMWANEEIADLVKWLRRHNDMQPAEGKVGFYGLDVYSLWDSLYAVMGYVRKHQPESLPAVREAVRCFMPYGEDVHRYARATALTPKSCQDEVVSLLAEMRRAVPRHDGDGREAAFNAEQNALVVRNAEKYYRTMVRGGPDSWNVRDRHMVETLGRLTAFHGPKAKAIVWEHNTHIGDARHTDMADDGMVNVGQLVREKFERDGVVLVGFGSYEGSVIAGKEWEAPMEKMPVPPGRDGTWEALLHELGGEDRLLLFTGDEPKPLLERRGHRAIGVVYHPEYETYNYVPTVLPKRYDAFLYLDRTQALRPLHVPATDDREVPETYPAGL